MPELPEVETVKRGLRENIIGKKIIKVNSNTPQIIKTPFSNEEFISRLLGAIFTNINRRGKYLLIDMNTNDILIVHLGMSGRLIYQTEEQVNKNYLEKHNHIEIIFSKSEKLIYNDTRRFGKIWIVSNSEKLSRIESLGIEPLEPIFTTDKLYELVQNNNQNIKKFLMDQKKIAGIGNIYANEILFLSSIHPLRKASSLTEEEIKILYRKIKNVLNQAIELGGTTMADGSYQDIKGNRGKYGDIIKIYGKNKSNCPVCGNPIESIKVEKRSTFFCSFCQK